MVPGAGLWGSGGAAHSGVAVGGQLLVHRVEGVLQRLARLALDVRVLCEHGGKSIDDELGHGLADPPVTIEHAEEAARLRTG